MSGVPERKPLTDEQIEELLGTVVDDGSMFVIHRFARAVEQAHGIGVPQRPALKLVPPVTAPSPGT